MSLHTKSNNKSVRQDLSDDRLPESTYIAKTEKPSLGNGKAEWVKTAYAKGVSLRDLITGSGLHARVVLRLCNLDPAIHVNLVAELEDFRNSFLSHKV